jgi:hypothetical protein
MDFKIAWKEKPGIATHGDVLKFLQLKVFIKLAHLIKRQGRYHYNMSAAELPDIFLYQFSFMFAMLTIGAEQHDDCLLFLGQIIFGIPGNTVGEQD